MNWRLIDLFFGREKGDCCYLCNVVKCLLFSFCVAFVVVAGSYFVWKIKKNRGKKNIKNRF